ncbi:unnamed protein product [Dracunculus medinensis]|uniref:Polysacc_synt_4 domain-containing protein n=1 Tax=Dracunculus medinensis TaxID=318479 RepID=A0A0N4U5G9_DRAME|nr:unnamed protein product [Dracunculus medinensis]
MDLDVSGENYVNDTSVEMAWACKAVERAHIHMNLILNSDTTNLTLHKLQDSLYNEFRRLFPEMNVETVSVSEVELKGTNKEIWRNYCEFFKETVDEYNLGTILRIRADGAYSEENSIIVPKAIFLAIEIARNKEGINGKLKQKIIEENKQVNLGI